MILATKNTFGETDNQRLVWKRIEKAYITVVHFLLLFQVADVVAINSCTPPPDLGGITSGDERVQIYVPPPQGTSYATINKRTADAHKTITFLHYRQQSTLSLEEIQVRWHVTVWEGAGSDGEGRGR